MLVKTCDSKVSPRRNWSDVPDHASGRIVRCRHYVANLTQAKCPCNKGFRALRPVGPRPWPGSLPASLLHTLDNAVARLCFYVGSIVKWSGQ